MIETEPVLSISLPAGETDRLDLATIRNPWGCSPHLPEAQMLFLDTTRDGITQKVASWLHMDASGITLCGNGSTGIITAIPELFMHPGDTCLIIQPTYFGFYNSLTETGMSIHEIQIPEKHGFAFNDSVYLEISDSIGRINPALIWICNPNNPTGTVMDLQFVSDIAISNPETLIIVDEAHQEIIDPFNQTSVIRLISACPNIIVTKTFSKAFGLPDIRIGIAVADRAIIRTLETRAGQTEIPHQSLIRAAAALLDCGHLAVTSLRIKQELLFVKSEIRTMNRIVLGSDSQIGMLLVKHKNRSLFDLLQNQGIGTDDFNAVRGLEGLEYVRIGLGCHEENVRLVNALKTCDMM